MDKQNYIKKEINKKTIIVENKEKNIYLTRIAKGFFLV